MGGCRRWRSTTFCVPPDPPLPLSGTISASTFIVLLTFDQPLQPGPSAKANWDVRADLGVGPKQHTIPAPATIIGSTVSIPTAVAGITFPPLGCDYAAVPPDVVSLKGIPAAPFNAFPLTTIP